MKSSGGQLANLEQYILGNDSETVKHLHSHFTGDPVGLPTRLTLEFSAFDV